MGKRSKRAAAAAESDSEDDKPTSSAAAAAFGPGKDPHWWDIKTFTKVRSLLRS